MRFKKILHSPTSTNHSLNARSPLGNEAQLCSPQQKQWVVEPSQFDVWTGEDSTANPHTEFSGHSVTMKHSFDRVS